MIDISKIKYKTVLVTPDGQNLNITELMQQHTEEQNQKELAVRNNITITNINYKGKKMSAYAVPGSKFIIYSDWGVGMQEVFQGTAWVYDKESAVKKKDLSLTLYDNFIYLQQSKDYRWYAAGTSSKSIIMDICNEWGVPVGKYAGPDVAMPKKVFKDDKLAEMILKVLDDAKKKGADRFVVRSAKGKAEIVPYGNNEDVYCFEQDKNVVMTRDTLDLHELVTRVKIIGREDKDERAPVDAIVDGKTEFGILQDIIHRNQDDSIGTAQQAAQEILNEKGAPKRTIKLEAPLIPFTNKGDKIYLKTDDTKGYFYVLGLQKDVLNGTMTMEVDV